jgi:hypothetical protein
MMRAEQPALGSSFERVLACGDRRMPAGTTEWKRPGGVLLGLYPLVLAGEAEARGAAIEALERLAEAWAFQACLVPVSENAELFDERGVEQLDAWLVRPWCRLVLGSGPIPAERGKALLARLERVARGLPSAEDVYRRMVGRNGVLRAGWERPDWGRVRSALRVATLRLRQEANWIVAGVIERVYGGRRPDEVRVLGARHLGRPLLELVGACQAAVARPEDCRRVREAWLAAALASLRAGAVAGEAGFGGGGGREGQGWWRRWVDRPSAWRAGTGLPEPGPVRTELSAWWLYLTECRLLLALRLHRDGHGQWAGSLAELVPEFLAGVPVNPYATEQIEYHAPGEGWELRRAGGGKRISRRWIGAQGVTEGDGTGQRRAE